MSFKIPSLKKAISKRNIAQDLPSFEYKEVELKEHIGNGAYGTVWKGQYNKEIIVTKKFNGESADEEKCFIKEARLIFSLKHDNIVSFKAFSTSPCAIMMEYMCFNFSLSHSKELSNLVDFLNFVGKIDGFGCFANDLIPKMGHEITKGLKYLHSKGVVHRDLKAKNVLVSNQYYCNLTDEKTRFKIFPERPVACKLADKERADLILFKPQLHFIQGLKILTGKHW